jgi:hypothetical protein
MKYLLCVLALAVPCISTAAVISASATQPQAEVADKPVDSPRHHHLLDLKFVLVKAPPEQRESPHFDFGNDQPAIVPFPLSGRGTVLFRVDYTNTNVYWCSGWTCVVGPY